MSVNQNILMKTAVWQVYRLSDESSETQTVKPKQKRLKTLKRRAEVVLKPQGVFTPSQPLSH